MGLLALVRRIVHIRVFWAYLRSSATKSILNGKLSQQREDPPLFCDVGFTVVTCLVLDKRQEILPLTAIAISCLD